MDPLILHVEDREEDVFLLRYAFKEAGIGNPVQVAGDGQQAIAYLAGTAEFADRGQFPLPALMLLDLKLPQSTGFEVLDWARNNPATRNLVVLVLSSSLHRADVERAYALHANAFLVKPSDIASLIDMSRAIKHFWLTYNRTPGQEL